MMVRWAAWGCWGQMTASTLVKLMGGLILRHSVYIINTCVQGEGQGNNERLRVGWKGIGPEVVVLESISGIYALKRVASQKLV